MPHPGIGVHAIFGELSAVLFLWTFVELYRGVDKTSYPTWMSRVQSA